MKTTLLSLLIFCLGISPVFSQNVDIPDHYFLYALIDVGVDTNGDSIISTTEAEAVTSLDISADTLHINGSIYIKRNIRNLNGIEAFINLDTLICSNHYIDSLDLWNNTSLTYLDCARNMISNLDVSACLELTHFICAHQNPTKWEYKTSKINNYLYELNVSNNTLLSYLDCSQNALSKIDISKNTLLKHFNGTGCSFNTIDFSKNKSLKILKLADMPSLAYARVWSLPFPPLNVHMDTTNSPHIKFYLDEIPNIVHIPDTAFLSALIRNGVDTNKDYLISKDEALAATSLDFSGEPVIGYSPISGSRWMGEVTGRIVSMTGIAAFSNLDSLNCAYNLLDQLILSNDKLTYLNCSGNRIYALSISACPNLEYLNCQRQFCRIDRCYSPLRELDCTKNKALKYLNCSFNNIDTLNVSNNVLLEHLICDYYSLDTLDVTNNILLKYLSCNGNDFKTLDISKNTLLDSLSCSWVGLNQLDVSKNTNLKKIDCSHNNLTSLNITTNDLLETLDCSSNQLTQLDLSNHGLLKNLNCEFNQINHLDLSNALNLTQLICSGNKLEQLNVSNCLSLKKLFCSYNQLTQLDVSSDSSLMFLHCQYNDLDSVNLSNLTNLVGLNCRFNNIQNLDLSNNLNLQRLYCSENSFRTLDISKNINITRIRVGSPGFTTKVCVWTENFPPNEVEILSNYNLEFTTECSTNTDDIKEHVVKSIIVYPNPTHNTITIKLEKPCYASITILHLNGQEVYRANIEGDQKEIDVSVLNSGIYVISVSSDGMLWTEKLVVL